VLAFSPVTVDANVVPFTAVDDEPPPVAAAPAREEQPAVPRVEILMPPPKTSPAKQKIESLEVFVARLPCKENLTTTSGAVMKAGKMTSRVLVKAVGENGDVVGWGEANPQTMVNAESLEGVLAAIRRYLRPVVEGVAAGDLDLVLRRLNKAIPQVHGAPVLAKAAVEAAVYDLWARTLDVPLHLLLGGKRLSRIPLAYTIQADAGEPPTSQVKKARDQGYNAIQIRLIGGKEAKDKTFL
jgi:muconate cycloisomerase